MTRVKSGIQSELESAIKHRDSWKKRYRKKGECSTVAVKYLRWLKRENAERLSRPHARKCIIRVYNVT